MKINGKDVPWATSMNPSNVPEPTQRQFLSGPIRPATPLQVKFLRDEIRRVGATQQDLQKIFGQGFSTIEELSETAASFGLWNFKTFHTTTDLTFWRNLDAT
jgi:hypothetical protein